jgi:lipocalin
MKRKGIIDFKIMKSDTETFIKSDPEMLEVQELLDEAQVKVETLEELINAVKQRGWDIKNAIEFQKFTQGIG